VDSGNVSAYANAAYVLDALYGDKEKALAVLEEGRKTNPDSSELEFQKGELLLHGFKAPGKAEAAFRAALAKAPNDRHLKNREDIDAPLLEIRALSYLGRFASNRGDGKELRRCYEMARAIDADHTVTKSLRKLVEEAANEQ
jgi:tetratricopeptide (TPR) repeat protein